MDADTRGQEHADSNPTAPHDAGVSGMSHDGQSVVHHVQNADGQNGQDNLPMPQLPATADAAVQATPVHRRVPVQAVLLSPASSQHQVKPLPYRMPKGGFNDLSEQLCMLCISPPRADHSFHAPNQPLALRDDLESQQQVVLHAFACWKAK